MAAAAGPLIGLGSSIVSGLFGRKKEQTQTSTQNSTSTPIFSAGQQNLQALLAKFLKKGIKAGGQPTQAERNQSGLDVNRNFDAIFKRLQSNAVSRGFNDSGKLNLDTQGLEVQRANAMQSEEARLREAALQRQLQLFGLGGSFAFASPGQHTEGTFTGTTPGQGFGQALGQTIGNAGGDFSSWLQLQQLLKRANGGGGGYPGDLGGG